MIDAGLYGIDVSNWKDEDFDCLNPAKSGSLVAQSSIATVVNPSTLTVVEPSSSPIVEPSTSAVVNIKSPVVVDPSANLSDVDISSWKDDDFKIPALPFRERKDLKGKIKKSSNVQANNVAKSKVSESPKPVPSSGADDSFSQLDVSAWKDEDFSQK